MHKHIAPIIDMYDASWLHLVEGPIWHGEVVGNLTILCLFGMIFIYLKGNI